MTLTVYLALEESDSVAELILDALADEEGAIELRRVHRIDEADAVVASTEGIYQLPDSLPERVGLLQLLDCGSGCRFGGSAGLNVANVSLGLSARAALSVRLQVRDAYDEMSAEGLGRPIRVGVIGIGHLGDHIVRTLQIDPDETIESIVVADVRTPRQGLLRELGVRRSTLDLLLSTSDVVVVAVHHGPTSDPLLGARELRLMGGHAWVVNVSGDGVVDASGSDASSMPAKIVDQPMIELAQVSERNADDIARIVVTNLRLQAVGSRPISLVERVTYPSAGDPAFWSSRMSPAQSSVDVGN